MQTHRLLFRHRLLVVAPALLLAIFVGGLTWWAMPIQPAQAQVTSGITTPAAGSIVNGRVTIQGTAVNGNFQRYELFFKPQNAEDSDYVLFEEGTEQIENGDLGVWQADLVEPGVYALRLRVVQNDGQYQEYIAENITVDPNYTPLPPQSSDPTPVPQAQPTVTSTVPTGTVPTATVPTATVPTGTVPTATVPTDTGAIGVSRVITSTTSRTITMLGRGVAGSPPDRVRVRLYVAGAPVDPNSGGVRPVTEVELQQVASTLQATGASLEDVRTIPFSRRPDGSGMVGEVRFTYRQPTNLTTFLSDALNQLSGNPNARIVDVAVQYGVADCATLEVEALRSALLAARARAEPMATVLNVRLGPVLSVSENVAAVPVTGSCLNLQDDTTFLPLSSDTPTQVEVAVTLAVTFVMEPIAAGDTTPSTAAPTPTPSAATTHTVQPGQSLATIASLYEVSVDALLTANNLTEVDAQSLQPGTVLNIPGP